MSVAIEEIQTLTISHPIDRCDRCGSEAFFLAFRPDSMLYFCGHHGNEHHDKLIADGWQVIDDSHMLGPMPAVAAIVE